MISSSRRGRGSCELQASGVVLYAACTRKCQVQHAGWLSARKHTRSQCLCRSTASCTVPQQQHLEQERNLPAAHAFHPDVQLLPSRRIRSQRHGIPQHPGCLAQEEAVCAHVGAAVQLQQNIALV